MWLRRDREEHLAVGERRPDVLRAAHCGYEATMRVLDCLGKSGGAAAEQQCCGICRRGGPQDDRWLGVGDQLRDCNVLTETDLTGNAQLCGKTGHHFPRRRRADYGARVWLPP